MILPLEQQVCSLESAKRLKELGISQQSLYSYVDMGDYRQKKYSGYKPYFKLVDYDCAKARRYNEFPDEQYSAYTVAELVELLPNRLVGKNFILELVIFKGNQEYTIGYRGEPSDKNIWAGADTLANAIAKMLIYLIENKLMEVKP